MPITKLDPKTALVVIDLQKGIVGIPAAHPIDDVIARSVLLIDAFRAAGLPIVLVNADGTAPGRTESASRLTARPPGWTELIPELNQQPSDHLVTKRRWGSFTGTGLEDYLKQQQVTQIVIVGVATSAGVESTARHAHELGLNVTLPIDAMTDMNLDAHTNSTTRIFPRIGETGMSKDVVDLLTSRSA